MILEKARKGVYLYISKEDSLLSQGRQIFPGGRRPKITKKMTSLRKPEGVESTR